MSEDLKVIRVAQHNIPPPPISLWSAFLPGDTTEELCCLRDLMSEHHSHSASSEFTFPLKTRDHYTRIKSRPDESHLSSYTTHLTQSRDSVINRGRPCCMDI